MQMITGSLQTQFMNILGNRPESLLKSITVKIIWLITFSAIAMVILAPFFLMKMRNIPLTQDEWEIEYDGYGRVIFDDEGILMEPRAVGESQAPNLLQVGGGAGTHAVLLYSKRYKNKPINDFRMTVIATTEAQLRQGTRANDWEAFWPLFNVNRGSDGYMEFNYVILKPENGLELGTAYSQTEQRYMAMTHHSRLALGKPTKYTVEKRGDKVTVWINDILSLQFEGKNEHGHGIFNLPGTIGLYSEDARVRVSSVSVEPL